MGNSLGCSPSGERLVSAARDGDLQEAQALIDFNPRLAKYSTFGVRNSPIHFAASQGHNEIVMLLLDNGVDVNIRNYCGQTALMQACRFGHWEVVQTLILYRANVSRADYLNARTALHFAAINGHARCIRLVFADLIPSLPFDGPLDSMCGDDGSSVKARIDLNAVSRIVNKPADGGITALHIAALNGHVDCVQLLLDLTASVTAITVQDGTTIDLIGAGSTPLHYAACGGSAACCQALISRGAIRATTNSTGWTAMQVARHWGRHWLEPLLTPDSQAPIPSFPPSRYLSMPLMSIVKIARECGWRSQETCPAVADCCAVCLERRCTVAAEGCGHELCTRCALYLCSTSNAVTAVSGPPGTIPCPLCRNPIVSFLKLPATPIVREVGRPGMSLAMCTPCSTQVADPITTCCPMSRPDYRGNKLSPITLNNFRTMSCRAFCVTTPHFDACGGDDSEDEHANDVGNRRASGRPGQHSDHAVWPSRRRTSEAPLRRSASVSSRPHLETRCWFNSLLFKDVY